MAQTNEQKYIEAVTKVCTNISDVPEELRTFAVCKAAVESLKKDPLSRYILDETYFLRHIPQPELCLDVLKFGIEKRVEAAYMVVDMRPHVLNDEILTYAVKNDVECISKLPERLQTKELLSLAAQQWGLNALDFPLPEKLNAEEIYHEALAAKSSKIYLHTIPEDMLTPSLCLHIDKLYPEYYEQNPDRIPLAVKNGNNIFSFYQHMKMNIGDCINYGDIPKLYAGEKLDISMIDTSKFKLAVKEGSILYDKRNKKLKVSDGLTNPSLINKITNKLFGNDKVKMAEQERKDMGIVSYDTAVKSNFSVLPIERRTEMVCLNAVRANAGNLEHVPTAMMTQKVILEALQKSGGAIVYVPEAKRTDAVYLKSVEKSAFNTFRFLPDRLKSPEICEKAVQEYGNNLILVPRKLITPDLCRDAIKSLEKIYCLADSLDKTHLLKHIPYQDICEEAFKEGVKHGIHIPNMLRDIPPKLVNEEIAKLAAVTDIDCFSMIPKKYQTDALLLEATNADTVRQDTSEKGLFVKLPPHCRTESVSLAAVGAYASNLFYVPEQSMTESVILKALEQNGRAIIYVPKNLMTDDYMLKAVQQTTIGTFTFLPDRLKDAEMCERAVRQYPENLKAVPDKFKTADMCMKAVDYFHKIDKLDAVFGKDGLLPHINIPHVAEYAYELGREKGIDSGDLLKATRPGMLSKDFLKSVEGSLVKEEKKVNKGRKVG